MRIAIVHCSAGKFTSTSASIFVWFRKMLRRNGQHLMKSNTRQPIRKHAWSAKTILNSIIALGTVFCKEATHDPLKRLDKDQSDRPGHQRNACNDHAVRRGYFQRFYRRPAYACRQKVVIKCRAWELNTGGVQDFL